MRPGIPSLVCDRVRAQISVGLDGELSQLERAMLASHLERCADCRAYEGDVTRFTRALRLAPLEPLSRPVVVQPRRRLITTRLQVGAAAAVAVAALIGAGELLKNEPVDVQPSFVPTGGGQVQLPSPQQLRREQAILERAQIGRPVQLRGRVL
jgi:predicted anti-sigma-YlaC factor YlaD